jgi:DNA transformation protein
MAAAIDPYLEDLFQPLGGVSMRRMFGGIGIWRDGLMFALVADDVLYLKSDARTDAWFEAEGCEPFRYASASGRVAVMSYRRAPDRILDDPEAFREVALAAAETARRADAAKRTKPARSRRKASTSVS